MADLHGGARARASLCSEQGQGMFEYGLLLAFVSLVVATAVMLLGPKVANLLGPASNSLSL